MTKGQLLMLGILLVAVVGSGLAVISVKNRSRQLFVASQNLLRQADDLDIVWGKLQLEHGAWGTPGRVQQLAEQKLSMHMPMPTEVVVVRGVHGD